MEGNWLTELTFWSPSHLTVGEGNTPDRVPVLLITFTPRGIFDFWTVGGNQSIWSHSRKVTKKKAPDDQHIQTHNLLAVRRFDYIFFSLPQFVHLQTKNV